VDHPLQELRDLCYESIEPLIVELDGPAAARAFPAAGLFRPALSLQMEKNPKMETYVVRSGSFEEPANAVGTAFTRRVEVFQDLLTRADHCRLSAEKAHSHAVRQILLNLADEYERKAQELRSETA
jgi:hypothetical protein